MPESGQSGNELYPVLCLATTVMVAPLVGVLTAGATGDDAASGAAFGVDMTRTGAYLLTPTPAVALATDGTTVSRTAPSTSILDFLSTGSVDATTGATNIHQSNEEVISSASARTFTLEESTSLDVTGVTSSCSAGALGASGTVAISGLSIGNATITPPLPSTIPATYRLSPGQLGMLTGVVTVTLNAQTVSNIGGSNQVAVIGMQVYLEKGEDSGATIAVADSACGTSGSDIDDAPSVTGITPPAGSVDGGTSVTITGANFTSVPSVPTVTFGTTAGTGVTVESPNELTVTAPPHSHGPVGVTVADAFGTTDATPETFTYVTPPMIVSGAIAPTTGGANGGTLVTISGIHLTGVDVVRFGGIAATGLHIVDATTLTVVTPAHGPGAVTVTVAGPGGTSTVTDGFTYITPPVLTRLSPVTGSTEGGTSVTLTGTGLTVVADGDVMFGTTAASVVSAGPSSVTVTTPVHAAGTVSVSVATDGGSASLAGSYTYVTPPVIVAGGLSPASGSTAGGTTVAITGADFSRATTVDFGGTPGTNLTVVSATELTVTSPAGTAGAAAVTVITPGGPSAPVTYLYVTPAIPAPGPVVTAVTPSSGTPSGTVPVQVVGTHLCNALAVRFGSTISRHWTINAACTVVTVVAPAGTGTAPVTLTTAGGSAISPVGYTYTSPGYWMVAGDGGVFAFGSARFYGSMGGQPLNQPIVAMAETPDRGGYWLFAADGGVFAFGDAQFYGSVPEVLGPTGHLNAPIVAAEATPDGKGYRLFAADGGVFDFGDAAFDGSLPGLGVTPAAPVTSAASNPSGQGYWLVGADGGIYAFGGAPFDGSLGGTSVLGVAVAVVATSADTGYWVFSSGGGVYPFGTAEALGAPAPGILAQPLVAGAARDSGQGYWLFSADGGVFSYGDAPFNGSLGDLTLAQPVVGGVGF